MTRFLLLAAAAAALFSVACRGTEPGPVRVTMSLDRQAVALDDSIHVALTLVNTAASAVMVYPPSAYGPCAFPGFEVFDREGRAVYEGYFCLGAANLVFIPDPVPLVPGETMEIARWWRPGNSYVNGQTITPGIYFIRGAAHGVNRMFRTGVREVIITE